MSRAGRTTTTTQRALARVVPPVCVALLATACGSAETAAPAPEVADTVTLGELPEPLSDREPPPAPPTAPPDSTTSTTEPAPGPIAGSIADSVVGYRLLLIGDTVLASTAPRNDGIMCDVLGDFGWTVELAAEPGRFIGFADRVLDERLELADGEDWDAAALMFGNHFDGDLAAFSRRLETVLERLSPRPTIVYTLSEVSDDAEAINRIIRQLPRSNRHVIVVDWAEATEAGPDRLLDGDGPQLTQDGSGLLVLYTAAALGKTPLGERGEAGECLPTVFTDDSAIVL